jgi:8-oxo-dGTP diphosphatase
MKKMVVGFAFYDMDLVYLIRKNRPEWQKDKLNGIGGKVENGETSREAMKREFKEEAGVLVDDWTHVTTMKGENWYLDVFTVYLPLHTHLVSMTDEKVDVYYIHRLFFENTIPNVRFLVPMCQEHLDNPHTFKKVHFRY